MKTIRLNQVCIVFALLFGVSVFAQLTPANAYSTYSTMEGNVEDYHQNGTFYFDLEVTGTFEFKDRKGDLSDSFTYYLNSYDGSMFFPKNVSPLTAYGTGDRFDGMYINPMGVVYQYWTDEKTGEKTATTVDFWGSSSANLPAMEFDRFRLNASKSTGPNHSRFGPTTIYNGMMGGNRIKMTIANRGVAIAMTPDAIGMMAPVFRDDIQKIIRVTTRFEMDNLTVSVDNIQNNGVISYTMSGYEKEGMRVDMEQMRNQDLTQEGVMNILSQVERNWGWRINEANQQIESLERARRNCDSDSCRDAINAQIGALKNQIQSYEKSMQKELQNAIGILEVYGDED